MPYIAYTTFTHLVETTIDPNFRKSFKSAVHNHSSSFQHLLEELSIRDLDKEDMEILVLNILDAFREKKLFKSGLVREFPLCKFGMKLSIQAFSDLLESLQFYKKSSARFWFLKGQLCLNTGNEDKAMECFINVRIHFDKSSQILS